MSVADDVRHGGPRPASVGDVDLCYDAFGAPERPALLRVVGLGSSSSTITDNARRRAGARRRRGRERFTRPDHRERRRSRTLPVHRIPPDVAR